jgi:hypothetical protein
VPLPTRGPIVAAGAAAGKLMCNDCGTSQLRCRTESDTHEPFQLHLLFGRDRYDETR